MSEPSSAAEQAIALAMVEAQRQHSAVLGTPHLFIALTKLDRTTAAALRAQGRDPKSARDGPVEEICAIIGS